MRRKYKYAWQVELMRGKGQKDEVLGTYTSKAKALTGIDYWAPDGEYEPMNLKEQLPMDGKPCIVNIRRFNGKMEVLFVHRLVLNTGAGLARIKYEK